MIRVQAMWRFSIKAAETKKKPIAGYLANPSTIL